MSNTLAVMNREQFLNAVRASGYAQIKTAKKYAENKDTFTEDDFIEVYRIEQDFCEKKSANSRFRISVNGSSTKRYAINTTYMNYETDNR